jgi:signal transduction histidine kinase
MVADALQNLRPSAGPCTDLERALCSLRAELMFNPTMQYRVFVTGHWMPCNQELQRHIYFIAQEAVTNAVRHSEATTIEVEVQYLYRRLRVIVRDNGLSMDPQALRSKHDSRGGLVGMLKRAANIDGQLKIWNTKGAGTEIEISVSVARN